MYAWSRCTCSGLGWEGRRSAPRRKSSWAKESCIVGKKGWTGRLPIVRQIRGGVAGVGCRQKMIGNLGDGKMIKNIALLLSCYYLLLVCRLRSDRVTRSGWELQGQVEDECGDYSNWHGCHYSNFLACLEYYKSLHLQGYPTKSICLQKEIQGRAQLACSQSPQEFLCCSTSLAAGFQISWA